MLDWPDPNDPNDPFMRALRLAEDATLSEMGANIVRDAIANVTANGSVFTGNLRRIIGQDKPHDENRQRVVSVGFKNGRSGDVMYGLVVELGRHANRKPPPSDALIPWVKFKHLDATGMSMKVDSKGRHRFTYAKNLKSDLTQGGNKTGKAFREIKLGRRRENLVKGIAFVIARSIGIHGIPARPFLKPAYDKNVGKMRAIFEEKLRTALGTVGIK
jgi:hypothetical protein